MWPAVSPDGQFIAFMYRPPNSALTVAVIPFEGGRPVQTFALPATVVTSAPASVLQWTADGSGLTYIDTRDGAGNLWKQPLDGGPPIQLTNFKADRIFNFAWSYDGKLALARGMINRDVIGILSKP